ncbi:MAG TPA: hypothetical protein VMR99_02355 [Candidatus Paceibacterota bacterium]|nr:hypothetical protein [Candidatus Paceibacterota bacterium]
MRKLAFIILFIFAVAVLAAGVLWFINSGNKGVINPDNSSSTSSGGVPPLVLGAPTGTVPVGDQNVSDGTVTLLYPTADFALATSSEQISSKSYIPPCDPDFEYCLYYVGTAYHGTNFESSGIRVDQRIDLTTQSTCLITPPTGYANFTPTSTTAGDYAVSEFTPLGDAAAGHFSSGTLYRLEYNGACYEFETRIGQSDFENYPSGTIQQFTATDQANLQTELHNILDSITLPSGETINFPQ